MDEHAGGEPIQAPPTQEYAVAITVHAGGMTTVRVPDVPGCEVVAPTQAEAVRRTPAAIALHLEAASQEGRRLPHPKGLDEHRAAGTFGDGVSWQTVEVGSIKRFSARDFMRARRPELYSDSATVREPVVDETFLHFALEHVTERKGEVAFEHFCRRLAEKEICPNLITQTGPTGGGDSKVDTETYPVAEAIAERWYVGDPGKPSEERWAFAFSAKREWRPKVRDDVKKIAKTGRGYVIAYFMTNQQVPDRIRGNVEDELRTKWGLDVRILDRNWIADRVVTNGHHSLFESTLQVNLGGTTTQRLGQADAERERSLEELDSQISDTSRYVGVRYQLAEDCLETALLARGLDRPRIEVDGRFDRAERIAHTHGNKRQLLRIAYDRAWTAAFWYEDFGEFDRRYEEAEALGLGTDNVWDLERLATLWQVGMALQRNENAPDGEARWKERTGRLRGALETIEGDGGRPTSSLMARTLLAVMTMSEEPSHHSLTSGLRDVANILATARNHLDFPFDSMARIVEELVNMAGGDEDLDELLEKIIEIQQERGGDAQGGKMRLQRAQVCLKASRYREAIVQAGKAQLLLGRSGADDDFLRALFGTACAYEAMGLLWAARANYAFALHWVLRDLNTTGELPVSLFPPLNRLIWLEIELGRIPQALCWLELHRTLLNATDLSEPQVERLHEELSLIDNILAIVVLRTHWTDLHKLDRVPGVLDTLGLHISRFATMFLLGYEEAVKSETGFDDAEEVFAKLIQQPAAHDVAERADWGLRRPFSLETVLFGCQIEMLARGGLASLLLAETVLAFIESFLATSSVADGQISARAELRMEVNVNENAKQSFDFELVDDNAGEVRIVITHSGKSSVTDENYIMKMLELLAHVLLQLWMPIRMEDIEALFAEERAQDRASITAQLPLAFTGVLGEGAKVDANAWMALASESLTLRRSAPWRPAESPSSSNTSHHSGEVIHRQDLSHSGVDAIRHRDVVVLSVLNLPLWDDARWRGLAYTFPRRPGDIPEVHFSFENIEAGRKIFQGWLKKFGPVDLDNSIRLTLVLGVDRNHPNSYRLVVGNCDADVPHSDARILGFSLRSQEMSPTNGRNLDQFLARYRQLGRYRIAPFEHQPTAEPLVISSPAIRIEKRHLKIVSAWEVGPDDFLRAGLRGVIDPVVPKEVTDPPFHRPASNRIHPSAPTEK